MNRSLAYRLAREILHTTGATCIPLRTPPTWVVEVYTPTGSYITRLHSREDFLAEAHKIGRRVSSAGH